MCATYWLAIVRGWVVSGSTGCIDKTLNNDGATKWKQAEYLTHYSLTRKYHLRMSNYTSRAYLVVLLALIKMVL